MVGERVRVRHGSCCPHRPHLTFLFLRHHTSPPDSESAFQFWPTTKEKKEKRKEKQKGIVPNHHHQMASPLPNPPKIK
jgi:hypothetical protein